MEYFNKQIKSGLKKVNLMGGFTPTPSFVLLCSVLDSFLNKFKYCKKSFLKTFISSTTKNTTQNLVSGFTLIETMVSIFILTTALVSMLSLTTSSLFNSKYANNEITASYLLQEAVDYIRNDRDSIAFQQVDYVNGGWSAFTTKYNNCFSVDGCYIEVAKTSSNINTCILSLTWGTSHCPVLKYDAYASSASRNFYNYVSTNKDSNFKRTIQMVQSPNADEIYITVTLEWLNGSIVRTRSLRSSLLNWLI